MRGKPLVVAFALTLGLSKPPREFRFTAYSTQLLSPAWNETFCRLRAGAALMAEEPGERMPPMSVVDYRDRFRPCRPAALRAVGSGSRVCVELGRSDMYAYRENAAAGRSRSCASLLLLSPSRRKKKKKKCRGGVLVHSALSVRQYLNAPDALSMALRRPAGLNTAKPVPFARTAILVFRPPPMQVFGGYPVSSSPSGVCAD